MPQHTVNAPVNEDAELCILKPAPSGRVFRRRVIRRCPVWTLGGWGRGIDIRGVGSRRAQPRHEYYSSDNRITYYR